MKIFDWNKIGDNSKKILKGKILILGSKNISRKRIRELSKGDEIFGALKDEYIEGMKGDAFKTLKAAKIKKFCDNDDLNILEYYQKDTTYLIKELKPKKVFIVNGSWSGPIHFRSEYWVCRDLDIPMEYISALSEKDEVKEPESIKFDKEKIYTEDELSDLSVEISKHSYCWQAQVGAVIAREGKILSVGYNKILPYEHYCNKNNCIREQMHLNPGQDIQICMSNHAESEAIDYCAKNGINISGAIIYVNLAPCPMCARVISRSGIIKVLARREYSQAQLGEKILKESKIIFELKS